MERIEITAKTLDEAIVKGLAALNTTRDKMSMRIIDQGSKGMFGIGVKDAKIVVSLKDGETIAVEAPVKKPGKSERDIPRTPHAEKPEPKKRETVSIKTERAPREESTSQPEIKTRPHSEAFKNTRSEPSAPKTPEALEDAQKRGLEFINQLIGVTGLECTAEGIVDNGSARIILSGADVGTAIGRRGETLDAIQYITNLCINKGRHGDDYVRVNVDTENYRTKREETLSRLALSMASKVVKYRKDMSLEPMNPYERRIIHATLQGHKYVKTVSIGDDPNRRVLVTLKRK